MGTESSGLCSTLLTSEWDHPTSESALAENGRFDRHGITYSDECVQNGTIFSHRGKSTALARPGVPVPPPQHDPSKESHDALKRRLRPM